MVETEQSSNQLNETAEDVVKENKSRKRGRKSLSSTRGKKQKVADIDSEDSKEPIPEPVKISEIKHESSSKPNYTDIPAKEVVEVSCIYSQHNLQWFSSHEAHPFLQSLDLTIAVLHQ